jgi:S-adenosylmethionine:tRNA ribosyltransferase-isomerase
MPENNIFSLNDFFYHLPQELIAQHPSKNREGSRLFVLNRKSSEFHHRLFLHIHEYLREGDVLVINNAKVIPARIFFHRKSGGSIELLLNRRLSENKWLAVCNKTKRIKIREVLVSDIDPDISVKVLARKDDLLEIESNIELNEVILKRIGKMPLPPYIKREADSSDESRYQTVYSDSGTAAAAPTAGLHFTDELIVQLKKKGVIFAPLTLDVSWGTFRPVRDNDLSKHKMHSERFDFPEESADKINSARRECRRVIAVGTTSLRVLEATYTNGINIPGDGETNIFIYPPYNIRSIDAMITNFHTPYSTLLMLVSAFAGYKKIMAAYQEAVEKGYRFFSYGDSMLIL